MPAMKAMKLATIAYPRPSSGKAYTEPKMIAQMTSVFIELIKFSGLICHGLYSRLTPEPPSSEHRRSTRRLSETRGPRR